MDKILKIGIVGCGAIGSSLAEAVSKDFSKDAILTALYDIDSNKSKKLAKKIYKGKNLSVANIKLLISKSKLVIEASSAGSSLSIAREVLAKGRDIMLMSVGGIIGNLKELSELAKEHKAKVYIPSGAVCGIDALKASRIGKIKKVTLTTRKHPFSFKGVKYIEQKQIRLQDLKKDKLLFWGSAREAVRHFPQNINVASVLSLAGIGQDETRVKIIASPKVTKNIHEISIESEAGSVFTRTENILHPDNPKTSYLAVLSALATLRAILDPVRIGT